MALTPGCIIYGLSALLFSLCILSCFPLVFLAQRARRQDIGHLTWQERFHVEATPREQTWHRIAEKLGIVAFGAFAVCVLVELFGLSLGAFRDQTECPGGWPDPRALRALAAQETPA